MALVSRARARFKFFGTLALAQFLARSRAPEKSSALASALAFNSDHYNTVAMPQGYEQNLIRSLALFTLGQIHRKY